MELWGRELGMCSKIEHSIIEGMITEPEITAGHCPTGNRHSNILLKYANLEKIDRNLENIFYDRPINSQFSSLPGQPLLLGWPARLILFLAL